MIYKICIVNLIMNYVFLVNLIEDININTI